MSAKRRFAPKRDRDIAALIAAGLRNRLGPDDVAPADAIVWTIDDVLYLLDHFAKHGTFDWEGAEKREIARSKRKALIPPFYRMLRDGGDSYEEAVRKLADEFHCNRTEVCELVPPGYSKKGPPVLK